MVETGGIDPSEACVVGETFNGMSGNDSADALNADTVFGQIGWELVARDNSVGDGAAPDTGDAAAFGLSGSLTDGTMTISDSVFEEYANVAVVLKAGNATTGGWIAYLVESADLVYTSIFPTGSDFRDLSHISLYGSGVNNSMPSVPLPAAGWMLLAGLGGLVAAKRRKR